MYNSRYFYLILNLLLIIFNGILNHDHFYLLIQILSVKRFPSYCNQDKAFYLFIFVISISRKQW